MNKLIKKLFGINKLENEITAAIKQKMEAEIEAELAKKEAEKAKEEERLAKLSPKELATEQKEPWISVLNTHVNKENIRNGFFELDWNEYFILQLRNAGYVGGSEEEVVDKWFQELCRNIGAENGINMDRRESGFVNKTLRDDGKTEIG